MRVGITGATGFIGSALARRHLERGDAVRCLSRRAPTHGTTIPEVQIVTGDLTQADSRLKRFADGLDVLYHCAAEVGDEGRMPAVNVGARRRCCRRRPGAWGAGCS